MLDSTHVPEELRRQLVRELCAIVDGLDQCHAASNLGLHQPNISQLRRGRGEGFSVTRLLRIIAGSGHNVEVHLRIIPRRFALPRKTPRISVVRYDHHGLVIPADITLRQQ